MIREGRVTVNGRRVTELGSRANPAVDAIKLDGKLLRLPTHHTYVLLHKPVGFVTTLSDPEGRPTVVSLLAGLNVRVFPVGRLDFHSSGLLLLTDDGELALRLTHPRYGVLKTYVAKVKGVPTEAELQRLAAGIRLLDGTRCAPADVRVIDAREDRCWVQVRIEEGRNREVRRMFEAIHHPVDKLRRVRLGPVKLGKLPTAAWRELDAGEVAALRAAVGL